MASTTTTSTTTTTTTNMVYSGKVIPKQAFEEGVKHVKPVSGYYIFFTADLLNDDLKGKVDSGTPNKIEMCCFHNVGYLAFGAEDEAVEALKKLEYLKWLTMDDWYGSPNLNPVKLFVISRCS